MENCYNVHNLYLEFLFFVTDSLWKECQSVSQTLTRVSIMIMGGGGGRTVDQNARKMVNRY